MRLTSTAFQDGHEIPISYTCDGRRFSPPLSFLQVPANAKSLTLVMDDIDVPRQNRPDGLWNHWLVWNIPPDSEGIGENADPPGISGHTTGGETEYQPPCPPQGEHRYVFRLYALDTVLNMDHEATRRDSLLKAMEGHVIAEATLTGRYRRAAARTSGERSEAESLSR